ncbi:6775_t:CDS:2, partial [Racocetra persica]
ATESLGISQFRLSSWFLAVVIGQFLSIGAEAITKEFAGQVIQNIGDRATMLLVGMGLHMANSCAAIVSYIQTCSTASYSIFGKKDPTADDNSGRRPFMNIRTCVNS